MGCLLGSFFLWASLVAQMVKYLPAMWETWVQSPGQEDPLEKEMVTHSSTLAWKMPWMEEPDGLQSMGWQSRTQLSNLTFFCGRGPLISVSISLPHGSDGSVKDLLMLSASQLLLSSQ